MRRLAAVRGITAGGGHSPRLSTLQAANSLALGTSPIVRALLDAEGGMQSIRDLDGVSFADWFRSHGGSQGSIDRMWDPIGATPLFPPAGSSQRRRLGGQAQGSQQRAG